MSATRGRVERRNAQIDALIDARLASGDDALAAIEVVPEDEGQRGEDLLLVRAALDAGSSPTALGALFITVVTNFAYEVDWKDHFSFWPRMHEHLRSEALNLTDHGARRPVASAFERFSGLRRGVAPVGDLAQHFPLLAWPLVHAVMPWCAQRHVARALERAATDGLIPEDPTAPWPTGAVEGLAASMRLPMFVMGLIENPAVLRSLGRALLSDGPSAEAPAWARRLRRRINRDSVTRSLVAEANEKRRQSAQGRGGRAPGLSVSLHLQAEGDDGTLRLSTSIGPYGRAISASPEVLAFARGGAALVARVNGADAGHVPLFNALAAPALVEVIWRGEALRVQPTARAFDGEEVPAALKRAEEGSTREFRAPLVFRREDHGRYELATGGVLIGERVAALVARASALADTLKTRGFSPARVRGAEHLTALVGDASESVAGDLAAAQVTVNARVATLEPTLLPALRRDNERLVFRSGRDVWLRLSEAPAEARLRAEVTRSGESKPIEVDAATTGDVIVRAPVEALGIGLHTVRVYSEGRARAIAAVEVVVEPPPQGADLTRWRVALQPASASIEHLRERQCWLEVESIPGVRVELELVGAGRAFVATLEPEDRGPIVTARRLQALAAQVFAVEGEGIEEVELRARASDEPESWLSIATMGASDESLRFDVSATRPEVVAPDDAPALRRLEFGDSGVEEREVTPDELGRSGLYVASAGAARAALCVCADLRRVPRLPRARSFVRSVPRSLYLLTTLRAVDVAAVWPTSSMSMGLLARRASARALERELVGSLCGRAWVEMEDALTETEHNIEALAARMSALLWIEAGWLDDRIADVEDPLDLLRELLERIGEPSDSREARHLTLSFYQRGMTTRGQDEAAVRWAWSSVRRARAARACFLIDPNALAGALADRGGDDGA